MKVYRIVGTYIFDYVVITLLLSLSLASVIFFIPIYVGVVKYFQREFEERRLKDIFTYLKDDWAIVIKYTILELLVLIIPILNIVYFNSGDRSNNVITIISFVVLIYGVLMFINGPILILNMKLTLFQLMFNSIILIYGKWYLTVITLVVIVGSVIGLLYFPYIIPFVLYFFAFIVAKSTLVNFEAVKLKTLKKQGLLNENEVKEENID